MRSEGSEPLTARISVALSSERFAPYLDATGGSCTAATRLYEWNLAASGALYEALGIVEVVVRNALDTQLVTSHGSLPGCWYDDPLHRLSGHARDDIDTARRRVRRLRYHETPGRIVAELNFGFWKFLLTKRYEATLWTPYLRHAFPNLLPRRRATVYESLDVLHTIRNRIAHHEPIHRRDLVADALTIDQVLDWIDRDVGAWAATFSRLSSVIALRPGKT